jgi:peptide deformylase
MALLPIITAPDPRLKVKSKPVPAVDERVRKLADDMLETMYAAPGIGLAAVQVGVAERVIVVDVAREGEKPQPLVLINPEIVAASEDDRVWEEGCLSLPEHYAEVARPAEVTVRYLDREGKKRDLHAKDLLSTCVQHEMDHLDGILFVDHLSALKRNMILRKLLKTKRQHETEAG